MWHSDAAAKKNRGVVLFGEALSRLSGRRIPVTMHRVREHFVADLH